MDGHMFDGLEKAIVVMFWLSAVGLASLLGGFVWLVWFLVHHISFH